MMRCDLHIHTQFCGHAQGMTVQAICRRADETGLETIAITDHIYGPQSIDIPAKIRRELADCRPKTKVIIGAEVDVDAEFTDGRLACDLPDGVDYIVAGMHYVPTVGNYPWKPEHNSLDAATFMRHWKSTLLGVAGNPAVHTLAHPGRLLAAAMGDKVDWTDALEAFAQAAKLSAQNGIAWEINELTGGRLIPQLKEKWHQIYEVALEAKVKLVYGSDAHETSAIGRSDFAEYILAKLPAGCLTEPEEIFDRFL